MDYEVSVAYPFDGCKRVTLSYEDDFELFFERTNIGSENESIQVGRVSDYGSDDFMKDLSEDPSIYPDSKVRRAEKVSDIGNSMDEMSFSLYSIKEEDVRESDAQISVERGFDGFEALVWANLDELDVVKDQNGGGYRIRYIARDPELSVAQRYLAGEPLNGADISDAWEEASKKLSGF